jgi:hypothetical protein
MGITVHYEGRARSADSVDNILAQVREYARKHGRPLQEVDDADGVLERVIDEKESNYSGRVRGIVTFPDQRAEPAEFLFGEDLFTQSYCKTQLAGVPTHVALIELLHAIASEFANLDVIDEGEYWESNDMERLSSLICGCDDALAQLQRENPDASVEVRLESGRIVDLLE